MTRAAQPSHTESSAYPARSAPVLEVSNLSVSFGSEAGRVAAVRGVDFTVEKGRVLGIVGESGSGKSVTSMAIMGLLPRSARISGSVRLHGREILGVGDRELTKVRGKSIAMVFQDPLSALTPVYTIGDQLAEAVLVHNRVGKSAAWKKAVELLDLVGIPNASVRAKAFPHEFSGGQRQRVMIAMAIANDPDVIIADEPTTALDVTIQAQIMDVFHTAQEATGAAVVLITHDLGVIAGFADDVLVMYAGKPVETSPVDDIFAAPRMPYTMGLLGSIPRIDAGHDQPLAPIEGSPPNMVGLAPGCPFAPRCPIKIDICTSIEPDLIEVRERHRAACHRAEELQTKGAKVTDVFPAAPVTPRFVDQVDRLTRDKVIELDGMARLYPIMKGSVIRRSIGSVRAVDGISFDVRAGETLGLVGESGCGKTTTIMEILGLTAPSRGAISVLGRDVATLSRSEKMTVRRELSVVFQDPMASLDPRLPVADILSEPLRTHGVSRSDSDERVRELLRLVGLDPAQHLSRYPSEFSGGQRQRIGIARALALQPKVVVLDEPVSALDVSIQAGVINLLERLKAELNLSYLFVAHDLSVVRHIADRVAVMYSGRIVELGIVDLVFEQSSHPYTQALLSAIPIPDPVRERQRTRILLTGDLPSATDVPSGCRFRTRCPKFAQLSAAERQVCIDVDPQLEPVGVEEDHTAACHYAAPLTVL